MAENRQKYQQVKKVWIFGFPIMLKVIIKQAMDLSLL